MHPVLSSHFPKRHLLKWQLIINQTCPMDIFRSKASETNRL